MLLVPNHTFTAQGSTDVWQLYDYDGATPTINSSHRFPIDAAPPSAAAAAAVIITAAAVAIATTAAGHGVLVR